MTTEKTRMAGAQRAQEARSQNVRRTAVQRTASEIQETLAGLSPEVAAQIGAPLDPTQGYSFQEDARPQDLPMPGQTPGGRERRSDQSFRGNMIGDFDVDAARAEALPDDHDQLVGQGIGPDPSPSGPPQSPMPKIQRGEVAPEHPVLTKLREDLGIDRVRMHDVEVGGHRWTLATLVPADLAMASRLAAAMSRIGVTENQINYQIAIASHSVTAIDGIPTYQVFGIVPPPGVKIDNPLRPPSQIRYLAAANLCEFLADKTRTQLPDRIYQAYEDKADTAGAVSSYLDDEKAYRARFRCPEGVCGHELWIPPKYQPGTKDMVLPFCQWHGVPMELVAAETERGLPLA